MGCGACYGPHKRSKIGEHSGSQTPIDNSHYAMHILGRFNGGGMNVLHGGLDCARRGQSYQWGAQLAIGPENVRSLGVSAGCKTRPSTLTTQCTFKAD